MNSGNWITIIVAIIGSLGSLLAVYQARSVNQKTEQLEQTKVDAAAYIRAQAIYEAGINQMEDQLKRMKTELDDQVAENARLRVRVTELERTLYDMRQKIRESNHT